MAQLQSTSITGSLIVTGGITGSISASIVAPGSTTQVLYNNGGTVAAASGFTYNGNLVNVAGSYIGLYNNPFKVEQPSGDTRSVSAMIGDPSMFNVAYATNTASGSVAGIKFNWYSDNWMISATRSGGTAIYGFVISQNYTERFVIGDTGNVGIGTVSPSSKLHVTAPSDPTINIGTLNGNTGNAGIQFYSGTGGSNNGFLLQYIKNGSTDRFGFIDGGSAERLTILNGGNVGIGTTSPTAALHIAKPASTAPVIVLQTTDSTSNGFITWKNSSGTQNAAIGTNYGVSDTGAIEFISGSVTNMILRSNGNLLVGTTTSTYATSNRGVIQVNGNSTAIFGLTVAGSDAGYLYHTGTDMLVWNSKAGYIDIGTDNTTRVRVTSTGNVGIGTTSPSTKLHVVGTGLFTDVLTFAGDTRYGVSKVYNSSTGDMFGMEQVSAAQTGASGAATRIFADDASNNYISLGSYTDATTFVDRLKILTNNGYVGIGTSSPQTRLHIDGQTKLINNNFAEWRNVVNFAYDGTGTGGYVITTPLLVGSTYEMSIIHVIGYGYGGSTLIDFKVVLYSYISAPTNYSIVDNGNDGLVKYIGKDSNGYLTICFGGLSDSNYFYRFNVNFYATRFPGNNYSSGWSIAQTTSSSYGMSTLYSLSPAVTQLVNGNVGIGTTTPGRKLSVVGDSSSGGIIIDSSTQADNYYIEANEAGSSRFSIYENSNNIYINSYGTMAFRANQLGGSSGIIGLFGGNVGINTSTPYAGTNVTSLDINATAYPVLALSIGSSYVGGMTGFSNHVAVSAKSGNYITLEPNDTEAVRITSGGNVGIGTTNPSYKLEVNGTVGIGGDATFNGTNTYINSSYIYVGNNDYDLVSISGNTMYFPGNGKVGIGTTSPSQKLETVGIIKSSGASNSLMFENRSASGNTWEWYSQGSVGSSFAGLYKNYNTAETVLSITDTGNVGIGTTSPSYKLHVNGNAYINETLYVNQATTVEDTFTVKTATGAYNVAVIDYSGVAGGRIKVYTDGVLRSQIGSYYGDDTFFNAGYGGNVGIGTSTPSARFHVVAPDLGTTAGNTSYNALFFDNNGNGSYLEIKDVRTSNGSDWTSVGKRIQMRVDSTYMGYMQFNGNSNPYGISFGIGATTSDPGNVDEAMRINNSGNVGIGTTNPNYYATSGRRILSLNGSSNTMLEFKVADSSYAYIYRDSRLEVYDASRIDLSTNGNIRTTLNSSGNFGIGTTSPTARLHVVGNQSILSGNGVGSLQVYNYQINTGTSTSDNQTFSLYLGRFGNGYHKIIFWGSGYGTDTGTSLEITTDWGGSTAPKITTSSGLSIGAATFTIHYVRVDYGRYDLFIKYTAGMPTGYSNDINYDIISNTGAGYTQFEYAGGVTVPTLNSGNLVASITAFDYDTGRVGIGTTSPSYKLDVDGDGRFTGGLSLTSENPQLTFTDTTSGEDDMVLSMNGDYLEFLSNALRNIITVQGETSAYAGYVGIGTATPSTELDVNGTVATNAVTFKNSSGGNTLSYYEENSWNPSLDTVNNDIGTVNIASNNSNFTRIGNVIHAWFNIEISSIGGVGTGTGKITNLPFTAASTGIQFVATILNGSSIQAGAAGEQLKGYIDPGNDFITLYLYDSGTNGYGPSADARWQAGSGFISGYVSYQV